tara:strand:+ start:536 stop:712 length:177 start_codon:yes stop_codon:yes gene_type:complete
MTTKTPHSIIVKIDGIDTIVPLAGITKSVTDLCDKSSATRVALEAAIEALKGDDDDRQ